MNVQSSPTPAATEPAPQSRWTPARQKTFLEALARCGSVKASAAYAGMSRESAHRLRRRAGGEAFARAWDAALIHARDLYAEELLDKGMNGWTETVWYHGEEVGERSRFSAHLLLSALGRLDAKADGLDLAGHPARAAAAEFDGLVEAIGKGEDCTAMLARQDKAAEPLQQNHGPDDRTLMAQLHIHQQREIINATAAEDIDTSDLDPAESDTWDDLQWHRAERSGMMAEPGFWEKVEGAAGDNGDNGDVGASDAPDAGKQGPNLYAVKGV